ncbi:MAG: hypothetical protein ABSH16_08410 [Sedimentisphaerales bacterium]
MLKSVILIRESAFASAKPGGNREKIANGMLTNLDEFVFPAAQADFFSVQLPFIQKTKIIIPFCRQ